MIENFSPGLHKKLDGVDGSIMDHGVIDDFNH